MGMFDYIDCEIKMPDGREVLKDSLQTKSLWRNMDRFTITATGRLIFHKRCFSSLLNAELRGPARMSDRDMDYHGDLAMHGETTDGDFVRYAGRFTQGTVEWIRPLDAYRNSIGYGCSNERNEPMRIFRQRQLDRRNFW